MSTLACRVIPVLGPILVMGLAGCAAGPPSAGPAVAARDLCGEIASIVCAADEACCEESAAGCLRAQTDDCEATLGALASDPRLAYVPEQGGLLLQQLDERAAQCWEAPFQLSELTAMFAGTGTLGADCTPASTDMRELQIASLSCLAGDACRLHLAIDGSPQGFCESRATSDATACSHAFDCAVGEWCNLPAAWRPGDWGHCQPLRTDGWACDSDLECESSYCGASGCAARPMRDRCLTVSYPEVVLASSPVLYLRLGERVGSSALDESENGTRASYLGTVTHGDGAIEGVADGALELSGMGGHVEVPQVEGLTADGGLTIELWLAPPMEGGGPILELTSSTGVVVALSLDAGQLTARFLGEEDTAATELATPEAAVGEGFHHIALSCDQAHARLFVDGVEVAVLEGARAIPVEGALLLGFHDDEDETLRTSLTGMLDEVALYGSALDAEALMTHVLAGHEGALENEFVLFAWAR